MNGVERYMLINQVNPLVIDSDVASVVLESGMADVVLESEDVVSSLVCLFPLKNKYIYRVGKMH